MTNPRPEEFKHVIISIDNGEDNSALIETVRGKNGVPEVTKLIRRPDAKRQE